jgi:hypothetical protein
MADESSLLNERSASPLDMLLAGARIFALIAGVVLILVGVVYAVQVFLTVGGIVKNPAALMLLFVWYLFWAWIPLAIIAAGGKLISVCTQLKDARREGR